MWKEYFKYRGKKNFTFGSEVLNYLAKLPPCENHFSHLKEMPSLGYMAELSIISTQPLTLTTPILEYLSYLKQL